ncbi:MAG: iron uptake system protein EfeO [Sciscionella sp.]
MNRHITVVAPSLLVAGLLLAGCVSQHKADPAAKKPGEGGTVTIELHPDGCKPSPATINAGPVDFTVRNVDADRSSEAELLSGGQVLGEQENLSPGLSGGFSLRLDAGKYQIWCPGAKQEKSAFTVIGKAKSSWKDNPALLNATHEYASWVRGEVGKLVTATETFAAAVKSGQLAKAKNLYASTRVHYERVEPVAEIWGSLDADIDARINDVAKPWEFKGFHKLEQLMFQKHTLAGAGPVAGELLDNVRRLRKLVGKAGYQPAEIANGATELVNEIQTSKVTGEEERYSHTDLSDFQANLEGAMEAFTVLAPALRKTDPDLVTVVTQRADAVTRALVPYQRKPGYLDSGYVDYSTVSKDQRRALSQKVNALGEELSTVASKVA